MNNFNIDITIRDVCCTKCCRSINERTVQITDPDNLIPLQDCYSAHIIPSGDNRVLIIIQKSYFYIVRFAYSKVTTRICLPCGDNCCEHVLEIKLNDIKTN
ncbi:MAG: hypothetical protein PHR25_05620 [Clostridia bacterium]|nr:hypothetical protein [Clostridia bacterium]MDD4376244.1 hypothetical protein [Clostridia bacterium]